MIVAAGRFKAECLKILDKVNETHEEVTISKRGKPVARLIPLSASPEKSIFGYMAGTILREDDILSPINEAWDADK